MAGFLQLQLDVSVMGIDFRTGSDTIIDRLIVIESGIGITHTDIISGQTGIDDTGIDIEIIMNIGNGITMEAPFLTADVGEKSTAGGAFDRSDF